MSTTTTTLKFRANADQAQAELRQLGATLGGVAQRTGSLTGAGLKLGAMFVGLHSAEAIVARTAQLLTRSIEEYAASDDRARRATGALSASLGGFRASLGEAVIGGENLERVVGVMRFGIDAMTEAVHENQAGVQALVRDGLATALVVAEGLTRVVQGLTDAWQSARVVLASVEMAAESLTLALTYTGSVIVEAVVQGVRMLVDGVGLLQEAIGELLGAAGLDDLSRAFLDAGDDTAGFAGRIAETELAINRFRDAAITQTEHEVEEYAGTVSDATDRMIEHEATADSVISTLELMRGLIEGTADAQTELAVATADATTALDAQTDAAERLAEGRRSTVAQEREHARSGTDAPGASAEGAEREIEAYDARIAAAQEYTTAIAGEYAAVVAGQKTALGAVRDFVGQELITKGEARAVEAVALAFVPGMQAQAVGLAAGAAAMITAGAALSRLGSGGGRGSATSSGRAPVEVGGAQASRSTTVTMNASFGIVGDERETSRLIARLTRRAIEGGELTMGGI